MFSTIIHVYPVIKPFFLIPHVQSSANYSSCLQEPSTHRTYQMVWPMSGCQQVTSHEFIIAMTWQRWHWIICMAVHAWWSPWFNICAAFFPQMRFAVSLRKISRSQTAKINTLEQLFTWTMAYSQMAVMAVATTCIVVEPLVSYGKTCWHKHDPFQSSHQRSPTVKQET